ncbi:hypothetical protein [Mesorhizobium sp. KR9-304]|uniref:hypothetical protein n=1 Tax=Mesorhizobium sp. KR9-304 TaxID=3156614 RepID=UPI0032B5F558
MSARDAVRQVQSRFSGRRRDPVADILAGRPDDQFTDDLCEAMKAPLDYVVEAALDEELQDRVSRCLPLAARPMFTLAETVLLSSIGVLGGALLVFGLTAGGGW